MEEEWVVRKVHCLLPCRFGRIRGCETSPTI